MFPILKHLRCICAYYNAHPQYWVSLLPQDSRKVWVKRGRGVKRGGCIMIAERCLQTCWFINLWIADQLQYTITKKNWFQCLKKTVWEPVVRNGLVLIRIMQRLDSKSKQHTKRFKLMKSELQDQALLGSVNLPNSEVNYKNVS